MCLLQGTPPVINTRLTLAQTLINTNVGVIEVFELVLTYIAIVFTTHGVLEWVHWDPYPIH